MAGVRLGATDRPSCLGVERTFSHSWCPIRLGHFLELAERFSAPARILLMKTLECASKSHNSTSVIAGSGRGVQSLPFGTRSRPLRWLYLCRCLLIAAWLITPNFVEADDLTPEEQALINKGATMEMYKPDEHSRHFIVHITAVRDGKTGKPRNSKAPDAAVCFVFGMEDAKPAREEGRSMAEFHYGRAQAEQFLFAQGWDKYHDRFFTRCYVQEGEDAFDRKSAELLQKAGDEARQRSL